MSYDLQPKTYYLYGYKIVRKYHYVDSHQHYDYIVELDGKFETYKSLTEAKQRIREWLHKK